ncbi:MAG: hypothetical protein A3G76_13440 [Acidobacteria bacterium RIFCSPLOWO2_12_FULL_65_11]|nr:MAG: hypothetical protein A3H95_02740 [Acidobacteria bacterium RIFCSPLOWO2_02_FULL_64_15]OFW34526.1 MAG: hypothetical protein A3G76_13440 [Acidobacteria bacterium RIFCSPLOWO2_12_FULL_65_11]
MSDYGRRLVVNLSFDRALEETIHALRDEGFDIASRIDVRDYCKVVLGHDFRRYVLIEALPARLTLRALLQDLDVGTILPATAAVYELADGETAVVVAEPFAPVLEEQTWRESAPELAALADEESDALARALARLQRLAPRQESAAPVG